MLGENGRGLTKEESTKSSLGIMISMEENSNCHGGGLGTKSSSWEREKQSGELFWRERVTDSFEDRSYQSDRYEKLVWPVFTIRQKNSLKIDSLLLMKDLMISGVRRFHFTPIVQLQAKMKWLALERSEGDIDKIPWMDFSKPCIRCLKIKRIDSLT
jgi:hypothetical protein